MDDARRESASTSAILTPEYASPEQMTGRRIATAADVYALGRLLRALLGGEAPRDVRSIVAMATRLEPERRYGSVDDLAADVARFLDGRPVLARRGSFAYRAGRFLRRNRLVVSVALIATLALGVAVYSSWAQGRRAQRRFHDLQKLARFLMFDNYDGLLKLPNSTAQRRAVLEASKEYMERLSLEAADDSRLASELGDTWMRLANLQGLPHAGNLGDTAAALAAVEKARLSDERAKRLSPDHWAETAPGVRAYYYSPMLCRAGRFDEAIEVARQYVTLAARVHASRLGNAKARIFEGQAYRTLGESLLGAGHARGAFAAFDMAVPLLADRSGLDGLWLFDSVEDQAGAMLGASSALTRMGDLDAALDRARAARRLAAEWIPREDRVAYHLEIGRAWSQEGGVLGRLQRMADAEAAFREALKIFEPLESADPSNFEAPQDAADVYRDYALALEENGRVSEGSRMASRAARRYEATVQHDTLNLEAQDALAKVSALLH